MPMPETASTAQAPDHGLRLVVTGRAGAERFELAGNRRTTIGASPDDDIILLPENGEPVSWMEIDANGRRPMLFARVEGLRVGDDVLAAGEEIALRLPARIAYCDLTLTLASDRAPGPLDRIGRTMGTLGRPSRSDGGAQATAPEPARESRLPGRSMTGLLALLGGAVLLVAASLLPGGGGASGDVTERRAERLESYSGLLGSAIEALSLQSSVSLEEVDGRIRLSGQISDAEMERLASAVRRTGIPSSMIVSNLEPLPSEAPTAPYFTGASIAPDKFVIARDGRRVGLGEEVIDGYRLTSLDEGGVTLTRGLFVLRVVF
ncbi:MAG: hypothetical protein KDI98_06675 [Hyphomicrobiaceae bacterium]|nr:hypothetical protein [Hyphomicrobiaceae bacterium]